MISDIIEDFNEDDVFAMVLDFVDRERMVNDDSVTYWSKIPRYEHIALNGSIIEFCPRNTIGQVPFELMFSIENQFVHLNLRHYSNDFVEVDLATYFVGVNQLRSSYFRSNAINGIEANDGIIRIQLLKDVSVKDYEVGLTVDFIITNHIVVLKILYQNMIHIPKIMLNTEIISSENILNSNRNLLTIWKTNSPVCCPVDDEYFEPNYVPHEYDDYDDDPDFTLTQSSCME